MTEPPAAAPEPPADPQPEDRPTGGGKDYAAGISTICLFLMFFAVFFTSNQKLQSFGDKLLPAVGFGPLRALTENIRLVTADDPEWRSPHRSPAEPPLPGPPPQTRPDRTFGHPYSNGWIDDSQALRYQALDAFCRLFVGLSVIFFVSQGLRWLVKNATGVEILDNPRFFAKAMPTGKKDAPDEEGKHVSAAYFLAFLAVGICFFQYGGFCAGIVADIADWLEPVPQDILDSGAWKTLDGDAIYRFSNGRVSTYSSRRGTNGIGYFFLLAGLAFIAIPLLCLIAAGSRPDGFPNAFPDPPPACPARPCPPSTGRRAGSSPTNTAGPRYGSPAGFSACSPPITPSPGRAGICIRFS